MTRAGEIGRNSKRLAEIVAVFGRYGLGEPLRDRLPEGVRRHLGNPDGYFNDRVVEVIDHLLSAPEAPATIALAQPNVLYEFADPALEAESAGRKLLLRMGPGNAARVKAKLREIRNRVATKR